MKLPPGTLVVEVTAGRVPAGALDAVTALLSEFPGDDRLALCLVLADGDRRHLLFGQTVEGGPVLLAALRRMLVGPEG